MEITLKNKACFKLFKSVLTMTFLFLISAVVSHAQPLVASAGNPTSICLGGSASIGGSPTATYGTSPYTYSWSPATGLSSTTVANPLASPTVTTTYTVTVTDAAVTSSTSTVTVTVYPNPTITVNSPTICQGASAVLTASGATTYSWAPSTGLSSTTAASPTANPTATTTYTVTGTNASGCTATATATVTVNPSPSTPTAGNNGPLCAGSTLNLTASFSAGATYSWTGPNAFSSSLQNPAITNVAALNGGTYAVTATVGGCTSSAGTTNVTVNSGPTMSAGSDQTVCFGNSVTFSGSASGAISYLWDFGDGGNSTVLSPVYTYLSPGVYNATLTVTGSTGCTSSDTVQITVSAGATLTPSSTDASCNGLCDGNASVTASDGFGPYTYYWAPGSMVTPTVTNLCTGSYTVSVTNTIGCTSTANITINQPSPVNPNLTFNNPTCNSSCNGNATATPTGGAGSYTYIWAPGGATSPTYAGLCAGNYTVTVTDMNGCTANSMVTMNPPAALSVITSPNDTICLTASSTIYATASGGVLPYVYEWNDGVTNFSTTPSTVVSPTVNASYTVTVTDANGCTTSGFALVIVSPNTDIDGLVSYSGGSLSAGLNKAYLFNYVAGFAIFDTVQSTTLDAAGNYHFSSVNPGDYLVKIFPDTLIYPAVVPTYYGDQYLWDSASVISHDCSALTTADITMVEGVTGVGPGMISGHISEGAGFSRTPGDPVPGIDIKLGRNPGGALITSTQTDSNGDYAFNNLPVNSAGEYYTIYVDIPGLERDSTYNVVVTSTNTDFPNLNYTADSSSVYPDQSSVGISVFAQNENVLKIYPNPATENLLIEFALRNESSVSLAIYNLLGVKIADLENRKQFAGTHTHHLNIKNYNLNAGVYFVVFETENEKNIQRIIISE